MLLTILSAVLFYLSFPNKISIDGFWPCIWFFAMPLLFALHGQPIKRRLLYGIFFGLLANGLMAQGLVRISPEAFLGFVLALSVQSVIFACLYRTTGNLLADIFYLPLAWMASEFVRNSVLGGFSFYISHAQAYCPRMLTLYGAVGCLGMSGIIFSVNGLLYSAYFYQQYRARILLAAAMIFLGVVLAGLFIKGPLLSKPVHLRVSVIQANISPLAKMDLKLFDHNAALHLQLTEQSFKAAHPDLVIWPETAFPDDLLKSELWRAIIFDEARHIHADLLLGIAPIINGKEYNSALLINQSGQIGGLYHKQALVPFSETTPLEGWGIHWGRGFHFSAGKKLGVLTLSRKPMLFGVVICSESAYPALVHRMKLAGAKFLVEISNDGWFTDKASYMLHAQAAVMRAVENRIWVIRAANTGFSFAVGPDGVIHTDRNLKLGSEGFGIFDIMVDGP